MRRAPPVTNRGYLCDSTFDPASPVPSCVVGWRVRAPLIAWVLGAAVPAGVVFDANDANRLLSLRILAAGAVCAVALRLPGRLRFLGPFLLAGAFVGGWIWTVGSIGRSNIVVTVVGVVLADAALHRRVPFSSVRTVGPVALAPLVLCVAAQLAWSAHVGVAVMGTIELVTGLVLVPYVLSSFLADRSAAGRSRPRLVPATFEDRLSVLSTTVDDRLRSIGTRVVDLVDRPWDEPPERAGAGGGLRPVDRVLAPVRVHPVASGLGVLVLAWTTVFVPHITHAGMEADDWMSANVARHAPTIREAARQHVAPSRVTWAYLDAFEWRSVGVRPWFFLGQTALLSLLVAVLLFFLVRRLGLGTPGATAISLVVLLSPSISSNRFWITGGGLALAVALLLGGILLSLHAAPRDGPVGWALHGCALGLLALSVVTYEATLPMALLGGALCVQAVGWRSARLRWAVDLVVLGSVGWWAKDHSPIPSHPAGYALEHALALAVGALQPLRRVATLPLPGDVLVAILVALVLVSLGVLRSHAIAPERRAEMRSNLVGLAYGAAVVAVGYAPFVTADKGYTADGPGLQDRINTVAIIGFALIVICSVRLAGAWLTAVAGRRAIGRNAAAIVVVVIVAHTWIADLRVSRSWWEARREQRAALSATRRLVPDPAPGTTLFTFGRTGFVLPAVPIFGGGGIDDLLNAERLARDDEHIRAYPVLTGMVLECRPDEVVLRGTGLPSATAYGRAVFVDTVRNTVTTPRDRSSCRRDRAALQPYSDRTDG
jgi:hypothetical protein